MSVARHSRGASAAILIACGFAACGVIACEQATEKRPAPSESTVASAARSGAPSAAHAHAVSASLSAPSTPEPALSTASSASPSSTPDATGVEWGLHIGGGPNDDENKAPIRRSINPHFADLARCFAHVDKRVVGEFSVSLLIPKDGGPAKVTRPRSVLTGAGFEACVVQAFEAIAFERPKSGLETDVTYSVRFRPTK